MILFRMAKIRHSDDLSGKGAEIAGGRWNQRGLPALYLAENRSLAILETIVHCQYIKDLYKRLLLSIAVPEDKIEIFDTDHLPDDWNVTPWHNFTVDEGTKWLKSYNALILKIPSAVVPSEKIFMVNPHHPDFEEIKLHQKEEFKPDNRLALYVS